MKFDIPIVFFKFLLPFSTNASNYSSWLALKNSRTADVLLPYHIWHPWHGKNSFTVPSFLLEISTQFPNSFYPRSTTVPLIDKVVISMYQIRNDHKNLNAKDKGMFLKLSMERYLELKKYIYYYNFKIPFFRRAN